MNAYVASGDSIVKQFNTLPSVGAIAAWALLAIGLASLLGQAALKGGFRLGAVVLLLFLLPIALRASYIINNATGEDAGRIATGYLYLVAFVVAVSLNAPRVASLSLIASTALAYSYAVVDSRETSFLALKTIFETNEINRIVGRIEELLPDFTQRSLIVIGEPAFGLASDYMPDVNRALRPGIIANTFASFRQPQIVDFFLGRRVFSSPTQAEVDEALILAAKRKPWPNSDAVFLMDGAVVVLLTPVAKGVLTTVPRASSP